VPNVRAISRVPDKGKKPRPSRRSFAKNIYKISVPFHGGPM